MPYIVLMPEEDQDQAQALQTALQNQGLSPRIIAAEPGEGPEAVARRIQEDLIPGEPGKVTVTLGGKKVPANDFVQTILASTIRGMVASLRGGDRQGRLEIVIE